ncbi:MAG: histidinol-phosphatase HisJ family protein [Clostridiales bacterium]|jgi:histidinol-phosphatase (PHP family)|nr:histidinol-phosphatase HisJ family protein [Clostridiales bacterium]
MIDLHFHTFFSPDSQEDPDLYLQLCLRNGMDFICFTDHDDRNALSDVHSGVGDAKNDFPRYIAHLESRIGTFGLAAKAAVGIELGYVPNKNDLNAADANQDLAYVVNSVHEVDGIDCYDPQYGVRWPDKKAGYTAYFEAVRDSLTAPYRFTAVGHPGYCARYARFADASIRYRDYEDLLDDILLAVIKRNVAVEVNSSGGRAGDFLPTPAMLERYRALGGRLLAFGSDAHAENRFAEKYALCADACRRAGFTEWAFPLLKDVGKYKTGIVTLPF